MKVYIKLISFVLALVIVLAGVSAFCASAEDVTYTQPEKFIYGDVDLDGNVTVKDATLIQKGLAKLTYVTAVQRYLADPEGTGYSVKNATAIQKYLAKYETATPWNTEIIMSSQDEFSGAITENTWYLGKCISVRAVPNMEFFHEYTLADFPEFNFSRIEKIGSKEKGYVFYHLYLDKADKELLLEAIKTLDYRANLDIISIQPDHYYISM